jgi:hypothetical protein
LLPETLLKKPDDVITCIPACSRAARRLAAGIDNLANTEKNLEPLLNNGRELADPLNYLHHSAAWLCDSSALR